MDKNTVIYLGLGLVVLVFVLPALTQPQGAGGPFGGPGGGPGFGGARIGPDGYPLPEDRVFGIISQLTALGAQIYDTVQSRRGSSSSGMPAPAPGRPVDAPGGVIWPRV